MSNTVKGLVALVSGGSSGLGRGVAQLLHRNGANVAVLDLPASKGKEFVDELGANAIYTPADVSFALNILIFIILGDKR
jgi:3-hydroxyacyl-CoA dehydrogenase/3-hydroxy-2-methylbutyryl-CoA dehydrogenase